MFAPELFLGKRSQQHGEAETTGPTQVVSSRACTPLRPIVRL